VEKNANWILDIAPDQAGKIPQEQIDALMALKKETENPSIYPAPPSLNAKTTASNIYQKNPGYGPATAVDDISDTRWATDDGTTSAWLEVDLGKPQKIGRAVIEQAFPELKRIRKFAIEYKTGDAWKACYQGDDPGPWLDVPFDPVNAQHFRLNIIESSDGPTISEFQLYPPAK
jgi:alpha-L-fucosidase